MVYSVLGDMFPAKQRPAIAAVVSTGTGLGMGMGQLLAGSISSWRLPFLIVSIPGFICALVFLFVKDPKRGAKEAAVLEAGRHHMQAIPSTLTESDRGIGVMPVIHSDKLEDCGMDCRVSAVAISPIEPHALEVENGQITDHSIDDERATGNETFVSCKSTCQLMKIPTVVLTILQAAPGALPFGFCATFLNDFLQEQRGMTKQVRNPICKICPPSSYFKSSGFGYLNVTFLLALHRRQVECWQPLEQEMQSESF